MSDNWSAPGGKTAGLPGGLHATHVVAIVVALILAATVLAVVMLSRPNTRPATPTELPFYENQQEQAVACLQGGGTWIGGTSLTAYCSHI